MNYSQPQQTPQYQQPVQPGQEAPKSNVDVGGGFKAIIGLFKGIIKKPIDAAEEFYNKSDMTASIIAIAMIAGLYVIASCLTSCRYPYIASACPDGTRHTGCLVTLCGMCSKCQA